MAERIFVIDDNVMNVQLVSFVLSKQGFEVEAAHDAREALMRIALALPDLILMDIQMPDINGVELTRQLKGDPAVRHIPVVALTAYAMKGDEVRLRAAGCDGYLSKPIDVATFAARVAAFITPKPRFGPTRSDPFP